MTMTATRQADMCSVADESCPKNQYKDLKLQVGEHELLAGIVTMQNQKK